MYKQALFIFALLFLSACQTAGKGVYLDETGKTLTFHAGFTEAAYKQLDEKLTDQVTLLRIDSYGGSSAYSHPIAEKFGDYGVIVIVGETCKLLCTHLAAKAPLLVASTSAKFTLYDCADRTDNIVNNHVLYACSFYQNLGGMNMSYYEELYNRANGAEIIVSCDEFKALFQQANIVCNDKLTQMNASQIKAALKDQPNILKPVDAVWRKQARQKVRNLYDELNRLTYNNQEIDLNAQIKKAGFSDYDEYSAIQEIFSSSYPPDFDVLTQIIAPVYISQPISIDQKQTDKIYKLVMANKRVRQWHRNYYQRSKWSKTYAACINLPKLYQLTKAQPDIADDGFELPMLYYTASLGPTQSQADKRAMSKCNYYVQRYFMPNCTCTFIDKTGRNVLDPAKLQTQLEDWQKRVSQNNN